MLVRSCAVFPAYYKIESPSIPFFNPKVALRESNYFLLVFSVEKGDQVAKAIGKDTVKLFIIKLKDSSRLWFIKTPKLKELSLPFLLSFLLSNSHLC
jgi:hypothetical protein